MATPRVLFFTGAPESKSLNWASDGELDDNVDPRVSRFWGASHEADLIETSVASSTAPQQHASWRRLPLARQHLPTGLSQFHGYNDLADEETSFLSISDISQLDSDLPHTQQDNPAPSIVSSHDGSSADESNAASHFYEHSFALHTALPSSQIPVPSTDDIESSGFASTASTSLSSPSQAQPAAPPPLSGHLSDLEDLPNASYLQKIQPQTMTVNLIVGLISISAPRTIKTRRGDTVHLIELLVGDETRAGFVVNFWLNQDGGTDEQALDGLRVQDVVLLRNVALSSFRGKVYGQSLRKGMTRCDLLFRWRVDRRDVGGCYSEQDLAVGEAAHPQISKAATVRDWVIRFVAAPPRGARVQQQRPPAREAGSQGGSKRVTRAAARAMEVLPPDSQ